MTDNIKFINIEMESVKYMEDLNNNPDLKAQYEKERLEDKNKKMEVLKIPVTINT